MKECTQCSRLYPDLNRFCSDDGTRLVESVQNTADLDEGRGRRKIPSPREPLPMRLTIIDQGDEGHRSRVIQGLVLDVGQQGMRLQTGTVETGHLNIIRDDTIAFKNKLEVEVDLPGGQRVKYTGFASWYKPAADGLNWLVGVYIRDMPAEDRRTYEEYLKELASLSGLGSIRAESGR